MGRPQRESIIVARKWDRHQDQNIVQNQAGKSIFTSSRTYVGLTLNSALTAVFQILLGLMGSCQNRLSSWADGPDSETSISESTQPKSASIWITLYTSTLLGGSSFARFCQQEFGEFPRLVGHFCSYLLPKQAGVLPKFLLTKPCEWRGA